MPLGDYSLTVVGQGFAQHRKDVTVDLGNRASGALSIAARPRRNEKVTVSAEQVVVATDSATPVTLVNSLDIARTPGADRTNSLAMITDYTPALT